jgi:glutaredoxin
MAEDFLNKHGVDFEEIDVSSDREAATYIIEKSGQMGVPIIEIDGEIIVGFNRDAISKALKIKD